MNQAEKPSVEEQFNANDIDFEAMHENAANAVRLLKSLANESRLIVMCVLAEGEISVGHLNRRIDLSQSALSQHLAILRDKGILASRKDANKVFYRVGDTRTLRLIGMMQEVFCSSGV